MKNIFKKYDAKNAQRKAKGDISILASSGFTLVETLVAIAILMIAIAGPLTVAEKGLSASIYARDQLIGSYLAQDGMEYIKNMADTNQINISHGTYQDTNDQWMTANNQDLTKLCTLLNPCTVDTYSGTIAQCSGSCQSLFLSSNDYVQSPGQTGNFTRTFYIQPFTVSGGGNGGNNNAVNVVMNVTWPGDVVGGGGVMLEDTMFDTPLQ